MPTPTAAARSPGRCCGRDYARQNGPRLVDQCHRDVRRRRVSRPQAADLPGRRGHVAVHRHRGLDRVDRATRRPRWFELLKVHNAIVRRITKTFDGTVVKSQGDGFMLAFSSAHAALLCAIEIERTFAAPSPGSAEQFRVRIGVHSGFVIADADDFYGRNVVLAARMADRAGGGEILVSEAVKAFTESDPEFEFRSRGEFRFKGMSGDHPVFALLWQRERHGAVT